MIWRIIVRDIQLKNLKYMMKFASEFAKEEIGHQVGDLLIPWRPLIEILYKCTSKNEKIFYIKQTLKMDGVDLC